MPTDNHSSEATLSVENPRPGIPFIGELTVNGTASRTKNVFLRLVWAVRKTAMGFDETEATSGFVGASAKFNGNLRLFKLGDVDEVTNSVWYVLLPFPQLMSRD